MSLYALLLLPLRLGLPKRYIDMKITYDLGSKFHVPIVQKNTTMKTAIGAYHLYPHFHHASQSSNSFFPPGTAATRMRISFLPSHSTALRHRSRYFTAAAIDGGSTKTVSSDKFTWDDVLRLCERYRNDPFDLKGFSDKIKLCNRNSEKQCEFIPFIIEGQIVGYVHHGFADHLKRFKDVFIFPKGDSPSVKSVHHVTLHSMLSTPELRTRAVGDVVKCLGEELIPGIRNELYPVTSSFRGPVCFSLERAAAPCFGIKAYGVHMNGYTQRAGEKHLWIGKRSKVKSTYPGMLDHLVAGGLPHGISCQKNLEKECEEEAGIPSSISSQAIPVGAVSYMDIDGDRFKRDVLFCYDLQLPEDFIPKNEDEEVESFKLVPVTDVAAIIRSAGLFKANCNLVIIDFLFRHGYIKPEHLGYLSLLDSLRSGDCS